MGYDASWGVLSAFSAGGCHKRERLFIIANALRIKLDCLEQGKKIRCSAVLEGDFHQFPRVNPHDILSSSLQEIRSGSGPIPRNDDGIPAALDRMKCLGNAVVPQQIYPVLAAIAEIEREFL
jgi:DNA (cytosine-5)-methyltransferase 1